MYEVDKTSNGAAAQPAYVAILKNVYMWMCSALVVSGLVAIVVSENPTLLSFLYANNFNLILVCLAQVGLVWYISARIESISFVTATLLFILYSALTGFTMSSIFLLFTVESIASVFFITAGTFAAVSLYGYITKRDLSTAGSYLRMALIGLIIASVVNLFMKSETLYWIVSYAGVLIFVGLTAYDTQKIKQMAAHFADTDNEISNKVALLGAITLYLDFINLFLYILRIFGRRK